MKKTSQPESVLRCIWSNGATIEVLYYHDPIDGEDVSDRIQLLITPEGQESRGWILNVSDATDIIWGLSKAMSMSIEDKVPVIATF